MMNEFHIPPPISFVSTWWKNMTIKFSHKNMQLHKVPNKFPIFLQKSRKIYGNQKLVQFWCKSGVNRWELMQCIKLAPCSDMIPGNLKGIQDFYVFGGFFYPQGDFFYKNHQKPCLTWKQMGNLCFFLQMYE